MKDKVIKLILKGYTNAQIAMEVGCTRAYVYYIKRKNFPERVRAYKKKARNKRAALPALAKSPQETAKLIKELDVATDKFFKDAMVDHPAHYMTGGIETYDFIVAKELSYELGNVVKYITRSPHKGAPLRDLQKARWYLDAAIRLEEKRIEVKL